MAAGEVRVLNFGRIPDTISVRVVFAATFLAALNCGGCTLPSPKVDPTWTKKIRWYPNTGCARWQLNF